MKFDVTPVSISPPLPNPVEEIRDTIQLATSLSDKEVPSVEVEQNPVSQVSQGFDLVCFASAFSSTFLTVFLAELGDKTQLTTLLMSAESHSPWTVFLGASCALVLTSLLGVLVGQWLASKVSPQTLQKASGVCLLMIAVGLFWDAFGH